MLGRFGKKRLALLIWFEAKFYNVLHGSDGNPSEGVAYGTLVK